MNFPLQKFIQMLGGVRADIDLDFFHHLTRHGMHITGGIGSSTGHLGSLPHRGPKNAFGQMTAATVAGAKNQYQWLGHA